MSQRSPKRSFATDAHLAWTSCNCQHGTIIQLLCIFRPQTGWIVSPNLMRTGDLISSCKQSENSWIKNIFRVRVVVHWILSEAIRYRVRRLADIACPYHGGSDMFCPQCGNRNDPETSWCVACGTRIDQAEQPSVGNFVPPYPPAPVPAAEPTPPPEIGVAAPAAAVAGGRICCQSCGSALEPGDVFCPGCGFPQDQPPEEPPPVPQQSRIAAGPETQAPAQYQTKPAFAAPSPAGTMAAAGHAGMKKLWLPVLLAFLVLAILGAYLKRDAIKQIAARWLDGGTERATPSQPGNEPSGIAPVAPAPAAGAATSGMETATAAGGTATQDETQAIPMQAGGKTDAKAASTSNPTQRAGNAEKTRRPIEEGRTPAGKTAQSTPSPTPPTANKPAPPKPKSSTSGQPAGTGISPPGKPLRVSSVVQEAKVIHRVQPEYPLLARRARAEATIMLEVDVDRNGIVSDVRILKGHPLFNDEAVRAVRQWKYSPTLLNGEPIPIVATVTLIFKL